MQKRWETLSLDMDGRHGSATRGPRAGPGSDRVLTARVDGGRGCRSDAVDGGTRAAGGEGKCE